MHSHEELLASIGRALGHQEPYRENRDETSPNPRLEVLGGAVESEGPRRVAWIEERTAPPTPDGHVDVQIALKVANPIDGTVLAIEVPTYNPYFGCRLGHLGWINSHIVAIYHEKHEQLVWVIPADDEARQRLMPIESWWATNGELVFFTHPGHTPGLIETLELPSLRMLTPMTRPGTPTGAGVGLELAWDDAQLQVLRTRIVEDDEGSITRAKHVMASLQPPAVHQRQRPGEAFQERLRTALFGAKRTREQEWFLQLSCGPFWAPVIQPWLSYERGGHPRIPESMLVLPRTYRDRIKQGHDASARRLLAMLETAASHCPNDEPERGWDHALSFEEGSLAIAVRHAARMARLLAELCRTPLEDELPAYLAL